MPQTTETGIFISNPFIFNPATIRFVTHIHWLFPLVSLLWLTRLPAQLPELATGTHQYLGVPQGLPSRIVWGSSKDNSGLLWLATGGGLCRYDGYEVTDFGYLKQQFNGSLRMDDLGRLLCVPLQLEDSLEIFYPGTLEATGVRLDQLTAGHFGGSHHLPGRPFFLAAGDGIFCLSSELKLTRMHRFDEPIQKGGRLVYADSLDYLFLMGDLFKIKTATTYIDLPVEGEVDGIHYGRDGALWVSMEGELYRMPGEGVSWERQQIPGDGSPVSSFYEDEEGRLLLGSLRFNYQESLFLYDAETKSFLAQDSLRKVDERIFSIVGKDFTESIVMSTYGGYHRFVFPSSRPRYFKRHLYLELPPGEFGQVMRGITTADDGTVFAHKDGALPVWFRYHPTTGKMDTILIRDRQNRTARQSGCGMDLINYRGRIYGTNCQLDDLVTSQVYAFDPVTDEWEQWELPVADQIGRSIVESPRAGELLVVSEEAIRRRYGRIFHFRPEENYLEAVEFPEGTPPIKGGIKRTVYDAERGRYWIGTTNALYAYDPAKPSLREYSFPDGRRTAISEIVVEADGTLLLGTLGEGLQRFDPASGRFVPVGAKLSEDRRQHDWTMELPSNYIAGVALTTGGDTLVTTFNGLFLQTADGVSYSFTTEQGLGDNEFNTISLHYSERDSTYYAGGINGFVSFRLADLLPAPSPHSPVMLRYRRLREGTRSETTHQLPPNPREGLRIGTGNIYFTLEYALPDYEAPEKNLFQTRLVNFDPDWTPPTSNHSVRYTRLPPGDYVFQLRAFDSRGRMTVQPLSLPIHVTLPWYRETWAIVLFLIIFGLTLYVIDRIRQSSLRRRLLDKQRYERRVLQLELKSLRQQMNPHFLFNAMNSIRDYILKRDREGAAGYLLDFSRLMRLFLESSRKRFVPVGREVELLRRYVRLEQLRFPGKFSFECRIDPELDPEMDELPSLILQPILENAIVHGLYHRNQAGGELVLDIRLDPDREETIVCTVSDNGVGRRAAARLKNQPSGDHVSRATQILEERQELLAAGEDVRIELFAEDIYPGEEWTGTRVTISFSPLP